MACRHPLQRILDGTKLTVVGRLEHAPQVGGASGVAAVGRVPSHPVDRGTELSVRLERALEVHFGEQHVTGALVDDPGDEVGRRAFLRRARDVE